MFLPRIASHPLLTQPLLPRLSPTLPFLLHPLLPQVLTEDHLPSPLPLLLHPLLPYILTEDLPPYAPLCFYPHLLWLTENHLPPWAPPMTDRLLVLYSTSTHTCSDCYRRPPATLCSTLPNPILTLTLTENRLPPHAPLLRHWLLLSLSPRTDCHLVLYSASTHTYSVSYRGLPATLCSTPPPPTLTLILT